MVFSSTIFLFLFLPLVLLGYYNPFFKGKRRIKNFFLLVASLLFYAWGEPVFVLIMILSIVVNWLFGLLVSNKEGKKAKLCFIAAVIYNIGLLFGFKYLSFITKNIGLLFNSEKIVLNIALPIGISFFTFQMLSYVIDVYQKKAEAQKNVLDVALYVSMFPQLIAGPIVRYETVAYQIHNRVESQRDFTDGVIRFVYGLGKKVLIADYLAIIADNIFGYGEMNVGVSVATAWLGAITYSLQIYFDFAGYSDMAIGLGKMFGFHFAENFNYPYMASSVSDFWRRWHISLSSWFRDYVYIPLGGNRVSQGKWIFNMFIVWSLTGIWHGANWTFLLWGLVYFVVLVFEKHTNFPHIIKKFSHVYTLFIVVLAWVIFRSKDISSAFVYIGHMFGVRAISICDDVFITYIKNGKFIILYAILLCIPMGKWLKEKMHLKKWQVDIMNAVFLVVIFGLSIFNCIKSTYSPFIYFNF